MRLIGTIHSGFPTVKAAEAAFPTVKAVAVGDRLAARVAARRPQDEVLALSKRFDAPIGVSSCQAPKGFS